MTTEADYEEWLLDVSRDPYRVLLIEVDHSTGTIYLASDDWMDEVYQPYDGWLVSDPYLEDSLDSFAGVGDFDAVNPDRSTLDWLALSFRGHACRWYFGDRSWLKSDFKRIATGTIDGVRSVDANVARFDLMDGGQILNRTFLSEDHTSTISVPSTIEDIMGWCGLNPAIIFQNVLDTEAASRASIDLTPSSNALTELKRLTDSIGAYMRFSQTGQLEVFIPEITGSPRVITEDDIRHASISMVEIVPAYQTVIVEMFDGTQYAEATGADTGELDETITYKTVLRRPVDMPQYVLKKKNYHATKHTVWRMDLLGVVSFLQVGDDVSIQHTELTGVGIVSNIQRTPLSPVSTVEVTI